MTNTQRAFLMLKAYDNSYHYSESWQHTISKTFGPIISELLKGEQIKVRVGEHDNWTIETKTVESYSMDDGLHEDPISSFRFTDGTTAEFEYDYCCEDEGDVQLVDQDFQLPKLDNLLEVMGTIFTHDDYEVVAVIRPKSK